MIITKTSFPDLFIIQPKVFQDERGYFFESYNKDAFSKVGLSVEFVQDNQSKSQKNTLRGLHFQNPPYEQGKLVYVIKGKVWDVAVDIRKSSPTFGQHYSIELTEENKTMLWIPSGFAHGFLTLENDTIFCYKCTNLYNKSSEGGILWNDPQLNINWNTPHPILSDKDNNLPLWKDFVSLF